MYIYFGFVFIHLLPIVEVEDYKKKIQLRIFLIQFYIYIFLIKSKTKQKYNTIGTIPKSNRNVQSVFGDLWLLNSLNWGIIQHSLESVILMDRWLFFPKTKFSIHLGFTNPFGFGSLPFPHSQHAEKRRVPKMEGWYR